MLVALSTCSKDYTATADLVRWIGEIGPYPRHRVLVVAAATLEVGQIAALTASLSRSGFSAVDAIRAHHEDNRGWPFAPNAMFRLASQWIIDKGKAPWLWLEPDAIPIRAGWLDQIEDEYMLARKPFMGTIYQLPMEHLNGVAVYPPIVAQFNPKMLEAAGRAFDLTEPKRTLAHAHVSKLFHRDLEDPKTNRACSFARQGDLSRISPNAVLFHGCKDGTLIERLRDSSGIPSIATAKPAKPFWWMVRQKARALLTGASTFYHSGNLGDVIYALYAIKAIGGGDLIIGPEQRNTAICSVPIDRKQFDMLLPLLAELDYLRKAEYAPQYPRQVVHDLNHFRNHWIRASFREANGIDTLCKCHFYELGIAHRFNENEPWLKVSNPICSNKVIVHRSHRYNAPATGPLAFPWAKIVEKHGSNMLFVGLPAEHAKFQQEFKTEISYWRVTDFLELARLIAGGREFIGNQSFPLSLAIGLGQRVTVEGCPRSPDCAFERPTYADQLHTKGRKLEI